MICAGNMDEDDQPGKESCLSLTLCQGLARPCAFWRIRPHFPHWTTTVEAPDAQGLM